jgi:signal transduction histidine kinase
LRRTLSLTLLLAGVALLAMALLSWLSYRSVRTAMGREFERRIEGLASTAASQLSAEDVADAQRLGEEGPGYIALQATLEALRSTSGTANASLLDSSRTILYDARGADRERARSPLATLAASAVDEAYQGRATVSPPFRFESQTLRAAFAPVRGPDGSVVAVVAVEALPEHEAALAELRQRLLLSTGLIGLVLVGLAVVVFRLVRSAMTMDRRLSRAENLAAMGRLTATLAHEIKNPLAIIRGSAQRLGKLEPEARRMADFVVEETDRLSQTVGRYLRFARGERAANEGGDAVRALQATLDLLEGELRDRKVTLERPPGPAEAPVALDDESLKQVYLNLVLNALESMPEGGRLEVSVKEGKEMFEAVVADSGGGIPADSLREIAKPFYTTKAQGSGLGLFLSRRLLESVGGTLEIESRVGRGTRCRVTVPRRAS